MSFCIKKAHKYANQHPPTTGDSKSTSNLLSDDYLLYSDGKGVKSAAAPAKPKKGGNSIRQVNTAQSDYY